MRTKKTPSVFSALTVDVARRVRVSVSDTEVRRIISHVIASERLSASGGKQSQRIYGVRLPRRSLRLTPRNDRAMSVAFVGPREMRRLNRTYHGEDRVTDVLAFGQPQADSRQSPPPLAPPPGGRRGNKIFLPFPPGGGARGGGDLGELIVCPSYVKQNAKRAGEPFRRELTRVLVHGTLHLLGYDHATPRDAERMFGMQEEIVRAVRHKP